jgi:hydrogenase maturation protease
MTAIIVAGVGNIFLGDDGFGVEVARRLAADPWIAGRDLEVIDAGIRALDLAYRLLDPPRLLVVADTIARGSEPGTIYLIDPAVDGAHGPADPHGMTLDTVFSMVTTLGGTLPRVVIVGCEPASLEEGMSLTPAVASAVEPTIRLIREIVERGGIDETQPHRHAHATTGS